MELKQILEILWRRKWIIFNTLFAIFFTITIVSLLIIPWYDSTTKILLRKSSASSSALASIGLSSGVSANTTVSDTDRADYLALSVVRPVAEKVISELNVKRERTRARVMRAVPGLKPILKFLGIDINATEEIMTSEDLLDASILSYIFPKPYVSVDQYEETDIIEITATSPVPEQAMQIANAMASIFITEELKRVKEDYSGAREFIDKNIAKAKVEYLEALNAVKEFKEKETVVNLDTEITNDLQLILSFETLLRDLYVSLEETRTKYNKDHPAVIDIENKIAKARELLQKENEVEMMKLPKKVYVYSYLNLAVTVTQDIYNSLLKYQYQLGMAESMALSNIYIVEPAIAPKTDDSKHRSPAIILNMIIAILLGSAFGIGAALLVEYLDDTIKNPEDIKAFKGTTFLGNIFNLKKKDPRLISKADPRFPLREFIRTIRNSIKYTVLDKTLKSIVITSSVEQEGKSFFTANLAVSVANEGKKVIIIDGDMRRPGISNYFNLPKGLGLTNYMVGDTELKDIQLKTDVEGLSIIPTGPIPTDPGKLIESNKMHNLIKDMVTIYDLVIIDTPPVLVASDAIIFGGWTDGSIMIIQSGKASRRHFSDILELIKKANINLIGVVLNKVVSRKISYYYYTYYK